jgi:hypothetical protein
MAVLFFDGFDSYSSSSSFALGMQSEGWVPSSQANFGGMTTGRFGGQAFAPHSSNGWRRTFAALSQFTFGASFRYQSGGTALHLLFGTGANRQVCLVFHTNGSVAITRDTTTLVTSAAGVMQLNVWKTLELEVVISDTVGRVSLYVDGALVAEVTNVDTANGSTTVDSVQLGGNVIGGSINSGSHDWDDLYMTDSATKPANPLRVETIYPSADGGTLQFTPATGSSHFALVDEAIAGTAANDFLSSDTVGNVDELELQNLSNIPADILSVKAFGYFYKTDVGVRGATLGVKSGATVSESAEKIVSQNGDRISLQMDVNPNGGGAWNAAAVNALLIRPRHSA